MNAVDAPLAQVRAFLAEQHILALSTIGPDGQPQVANLYYAGTEDLDFYFLSSARSRHAANIARSPSIAAAIHADSVRWRDIRGVQLEGTCTRLSGVERARAWTRYTAKFHFVLADGALAATLQKADMYRITPRWLRWIDNSVRLGHNQEWIMTDGTWRPVLPAES